MPGNRLATSPAFRFETFPQRIGGRDLAEVGREALGRDRGGVALAFPDDPELREAVDRRREVKIPCDAPVGRDGHRDALGIESQVGDHDFVGSGGHGREGITATGVGEGP